MSLTHATVPVFYRYRQYQRPVWDAFRQGIKRHCLVWHRRSGKDLTLFNLLLATMCKRVGNYKYVVPTLVQGRDTLWDAIDGNGHYLRDHIPSALLFDTNESEMSFTLRHPVRQDEPGSNFRIVGTDRNLNALVGGNPVGLVFSEYSLQHPMAWTLAQPILRENGGWAAFCYTPRGVANHGQALFKIAQANPKEWHSSLLTIDDTRRDAEGEAGEPVVRREEVQADIDSGLIEEAFAQQEYWVSFDAPLQGSYYAEQFKKADAEGRVGVVPWTPNKPVYTAWDLGVDDSTAIWFLQPVGDRINVIDYYEFWGHGIEHYVKVLREKPYVYATHYAPHDIEVREWGARNPGTTEARSRKDVAADLGLAFVTTGQWAIIDGIQAVRLLFPRFHFDAERCGHGLLALREYQRLWDDKRKIFLNEPYHNWASHGADALRTFAVGWHDTESIGPQSSRLPLVARGAPFTQRMAQEQQRQGAPLRAVGGLRG